MEIKIARINPWLFVSAVPSSQTYTSASEVALFSVYVCVFACVCVCVCVYVCVDCLSMIKQIVVGFC